MKDLLAYASSASTTYQMVGLRSDTQYSQPTRNENSMRTMNVEVTIEKPQALGKDGEMPKGVSKTTTVRVPVPDAKDWENVDAWEKCFTSFKKWDSDGYLDEAPSVGNVMEAGVKVIARAAGQQRINEAVRKAMGKTGGKGKKSTVTFD